MDKTWYILFVMTGTEDKNCTFFNRNEMNCFVPKWEAVHKHQGQVEIVEKVMFPGYLFFQSDLTQLEFDSKIKQLRQQTKGVIKELKYKDDVTALTIEEQRNLEHMLNQEEVLTMSTGIIENDRVIVLDGPLKGYESQIVHIDRHKRQATLQIDLCGRPTKVKASLEIIKKI